MEKYTYEKLIEKITRARVKLEGMHCPHASTCAFEASDYYGPCVCGADDVNALLRSVIGELEL